MSEPASYLLLEDGSLFPGRSVAAAGVAFGEAVFTTAMTGYQEVVSDPSYHEQLVCFTAPMVGNYGVAGSRMESAAIHAKGVLMRRAGGAAWTSWLAEHGVPALEDVDTRRLVLCLREQGAMRAALVAASERSPDELLAEVRAQAPMAGRALAGDVSTAEPYSLGEGDLQVAVLDYGCKRSILQRLAASGVRVSVFPNRASAEQLLAARPDGVLLSNGPGDPAVLSDEVATVRELVGRVPLFGICLGHQLLGLAVGLETFKLPFGHRGANHPVLEQASGRVLVTCQNHGFAVHGEGEAVSHLSLYDGTVEGLALPQERARSLQFHPEAGPGPHDAWSLIDAWSEELRSAKAS